MPAGGQTVRQLSISAARGTGLSKHPFGRRKLAAAATIVLGVTVIGVIGGSLGMALGVGALLMGTMFLAMQIAQTRRQFARLENSVQRSVERLARQPTKAVPRIVTRERSEARRLGRAVWGGVLRLVR